MYSNLFASALLCAGLLFTGVETAQKEPAAGADCCSKKLACCGKDKACCVSTVKIGCCAKGLECCAKDRACCGGVQDCCKSGAACCSEGKSCCGQPVKQEAKASGPAGKGCCSAGSCCKTDIK